MKEILYPIGIQNFESLRRGGYLYVDKTAILHRMVRTGSYYFLSRPRRFGKSLLVSTLQAYFEGKRELFDGLAMQELEKDWTKHPVLHLDLNIGRYDTPEELELVLNDTLKEWEKQYGTEDSEVTPTLRFNGIIERAHRQTGQRVVILVDECEKPMRQAIGNKELRRKFHRELDAFYSLNNLSDITMNEQYIDVCGITEQELHRYFETSIGQLAAAQGLTCEEASTELGKQYGGYHFIPCKEAIYNPFSLLNAFKYREFGNYWFQTGIPAYMWELLRGSDYDLNRIVTKEITTDALNSIFNDDDSGLVPVIYQSGYLTIKGYDSEFDICTLGFPNREVEEGIIKSLVPLVDININNK